MTRPRKKIVSPAKSNGRRAELVLRPAATFEVARRLQNGIATLGEIYAFCSGLHFRGKLRYAAKFARPPVGVAGVQVITATRGLVPAQTCVRPADLHEFSTIPIHAAETRFTRPLQETVRVLAAAHECEIVLLGSIASGKYVECLLPILDRRLLFPAQFVGRGDMSRGGLLLRCVSSSQELEYIPVTGAVRRGQRPARLPARKSQAASPRSP